MTRMAKRKEWVQRIAEYQNSGLSIQAWCNRQGIKSSIFYYWYNKFNQENSSPPFKSDSTNQFISILPENIDNHSSKSTSTTSRPSSLKLTIDRFTLNIPADVDICFLRDVLHLIRQCQDDMVSQVYTLSESERVWMVSFIR